MPPILFWMAAAGASAIIADQSLMGGTFTAKAFVGVAYIFVNSGNIVLDHMFSLFPETWNLSFAVIEPYFGFVNSWLPLNVGFSLFALYWTIWASVTVTRWAMKCVPFLNLG